MSPVRFMFLAGAMALSGCDLVEQVLTGIETACGRNDWSVPTVTVTAPDSVCDARTGNCDSLEAAIKAVNACPIPRSRSIRLASGTYSFPDRPVVQLPPLKGKIDIRGAGAERTVLQGRAEIGSRILTISRGSQVRVSEMTIAETDFGAIYNAGILDVFNVRFVDNQADLGAAILNNGFLQVSESTFVGNHAAAGGAIFSSGAGSVQISGSVFEENTVDSHVSFEEQYYFHKGGAIYSLNTLRVRSSSFISNAAIQGGAIYFSGQYWDFHAQSFIQDSEFTANGPETSGSLNKGGAIFSGRPLEITRSHFRDNFAKGGQGSAIYDAGIQDPRSPADGVSSLVVSASFTGNGAEGDEDKGVVVAAGTARTILGGKFDGNTAQTILKGYGASFLLAGGSEFFGNFSNTIVESSEESSVQVSSSSFFENEAEVIVLAAGREFRLEVSTIRTNSSGLQCVNGVVHLSDATILGSASGIGLETNDCTPFIRNSVIGRFGRNCMLHRSAGRTYPDPAGANISTDDSCPRGFQQFSLLRLSPLANSDGRTIAFLPASNSPLVDIGGTVCSREDQRRASRPQDGNGDGSRACDVGSIERTP